MYRLATKHTKTSRRKLERESFRQSVRRALVVLGSVNQ